MCVREREGEMRVELWRNKRMLVATAIQYFRACPPCPAPNDAQRNRHTQRGCGERRATVSVSPPLRTRAVGSARRAAVAAATTDLNESTFGSPNVIKLHLKSSLLCHLLNLRCNFLLHRTFHLSIHTLGRCKVTQDCFAVATRQITTETVDQQRMEE